MRISSWNEANEDVHDIIHIDTCFRCGILRCRDVCAFTRIHETVDSLDVVGECYDVAREDKDHSNDAEDPDGIERDENVCHKERLVCRSRRQTRKKARTSTRWKHYGVRLLALFYSLDCGTEIKLGSWQSW